MVAGIHEAVSQKVEASLQQQLEGDQESENDPIRQLVKGIPAEIAQWIANFFASYVESAPFGSSVRSVGQRTDQQGAGA